MYGFIAIRSVYLYNNILPASVQSRGTRMNNTNVQFVKIVSIILSISMFFYYLVNGTKNYEVSIEEYRDLAKIKAEAIKTLDKSNFKESKYVKFKLSVDHAYFYFPTDAEIMVTKEQLLNLLSKIKEISVDKKITNFEFAEIGTIIQNFIDNEKLMQKKELLNKLTK